MIVPILKFFGLQTNVGNARPGTAAVLKNFMRNQKRGWLNAGQGYFKKFVSDTDNGLPQTTDNAGDNYLDPAIHGISNLVWKDVHNFYVPENGGADVTVAVGTYRKAKFEAAGWTKDRFGIWIRPYWNGAAWVDAWRELTELFIFKIESLPIAPHQDRIVVSTNFSAYDPAGEVFNNSYFVGWTAAYVDFVTPVFWEDTENFDRVTACGDETGGGTDFFLDIGHANTDFASRAVGNYVYVYRNFLFKDLPSSLTSYIFNLFNELRMTTGTGADDVSLMAGYRSKDIVSGGISVTGVIADIAALDLWDYAVAVTGAVVAEGTDPLTAGTYYLKFAVVMDDGNVTKLYDAVTDTGGGIAAGNSFVIGANQKLFVRPYVSYGAVPRRFSRIVLFISTDDITYNFISDITPVFNAGTMLTLPGPVEHFYMQCNAISLLGATYAAIGEDAVVNIGRSITDSGIVRWKVGTVIGKKTYVGNVLAGGAAKPNNAMVGTGKGSGVLQTDVFANDEAHIIDLEYGDGDEIIGIAPVVERVLFLKKRSIVLVAPDGQGGYIREMISANIGCSSAEAVAVHNGIVYWFDDNGRYAFGFNGGLQTLDLLANDDWQLLTTAQKEAGSSAIDRVNQLWYVNAGGKQWIYDINAKTIEGDAAGDWVKFEFTDTPLRIAGDIPGTVDFITTAGKLLTINNADVTAWGFDGADYTLQWKSNEIMLLREQGYDGRVLVKGWGVEYSSSIDITLNIYLDGGTAIVFTMPLTETTKIFRMPLGSVCKSVVFEFTAVTAGETPDISIKGLQAFVDKMPGSVM